MKGKIKLPKGFKYSIDHESGDATPVLTRKMKKDTKQIFYLPIDSSGNLFAFTFNCQVHLGSFAQSPKQMDNPSIEINFMYHPNKNDFLELYRIFVTDEEGGYSADFNGMPTDDEFDAKTNHFTKPKRLALKVLRSLLDDVEVPSVFDTRQCFFYLIKKHEAIANEQIVKLTESFLHRIETPNKIKTGLYRKWNDLNPQEQRDGTIK